MSLNRMILIGHDPELRYTTGGTAVERARETLRRD